MEVSLGYWIMTDKAVRILLSANDFLKSMQDVSSILSRLGCLTASLGI